MDVIPASNYQNGITFTCSIVVHGLSKEITDTMITHLYDPAHVGK